MSDPLALTISAQDPLADALTHARSTTALGDRTAVDEAYGVLMRLVESSGTRAPELWSALAAEHVGALRVLGAMTLAAVRCDGYLGDELRAPGAGREALLLERAQLRSSVGDHVRAADDAHAIRVMLGSRMGAMGRGDYGRLRRVEGLAWADAGDTAAALLCLDDAQDAFRSADHAAGVAVIEQDRRLIAVRRGSAAEVSEVLAGPVPESIAGRLMLVLALKRRLRYEEALAVVLDIVTSDDLDERLHLTALGELTSLLQLLRRGAAVMALVEVLGDAVRLRLDALAAEAPAAGKPVARSESMRYERAMWNVVRRIEDGDLDGAESWIIELRSLARNDRDTALWHLTAGELEITRYERRHLASALRDAAVHFGAAAEHAADVSVLEVRIRALRRLGESFARLGEHSRGARCWAEAHRLEEGIASCQISDDVRIHLLLDVSDEYDERIRLAAKSVALASDSHTVAASVATLLVAMEAARGAAILSRVLPDAAEVFRDLPGPGDPEGAWRWMRAHADRLPRDQVLWVMHATPDRVHHVVLGRNTLRHFSFEVRRSELAAAITKLSQACNEHLLQLEEVRTEFLKDAEVLASRLGVAEVAACLPTRVRRVTVVAGGVLSDVPLAALPVPASAADSREPLGCRFALSDLPCLSVRQALRRRSVGLRGETRLLVDAYEENPVPEERDAQPESQEAHAAHLGARPVRRPLSPDSCDAVLSGPTATPWHLGHELARRMHRVVRIYSHGQSDSEVSKQTFLELVGSEAGPSGRLYPDELQWMDLSGCGTLILGACESGMGQRAGRDERTGFVRAALHAGAASVVAARWVASVAAAAPILDRFEHYARYLPRDVALQRAQADMRRGALPLHKKLTDIGHPAWWACWTLYGDCGLQTKAGLALRWIRRLRDRIPDATDPEANDNDERRRHVAPA